MTTSPKPIARLVEEPTYRPTPRTDESVLRLDANEGPQLPMSFGALEERLGREYPDVRSLQGAVAEKLGRAPEEVIVTSGGDGAIDAVMRAFAGPRSTVVVPDPTFEMTTKYARIAGASIARVPWEDDFPLGNMVEASADASVVVVVSPDNPTGRVVEPEVIAELATRLPQAIVLLDLAYVEYADDDPTDFARQFPNVIVVRTFSKALGLAGLRVGYAIADPEIAERLRAVVSPYPVSGVSAEIARTRLLRQQEIDRHVERVRWERDQVYEQLELLGACPMRSEANFVFARFTNANLTCRALLAQGVRVRQFDRPGLEDALRIACPGEDHGFERLQHALANALAPQALLFDMDGVLADVSRSYREAIRRTCECFGVAVTPEQISAAKRRPNANDDWEVTRSLLEVAGRDVPLDRVTEQFEALYQGSLWERERLLVNLEWLRGLRSKYALAVVTGRPRRDAERFLQKEGIAELFDAVVCREDAPLKPSPAPVLRALEQLGCETGWMFGDTVDDLLAARAAGIVPIGVCALGEANAETRRVLGELSGNCVVDEVMEVSRWLR